MNFQKTSQEQLKKLNLIDGHNYKIKYLNRDYFNGDENIETAQAKVIIDENREISFIVTDDYGMDKFIKEVEFIS